MLAVKFYKHLGSTQKHNILQHYSRYVMTQTTKTLQKQRSMIAEKDCISDLCAVAANTDDEDILGMSVT